MRFTAEQYNVAIQMLQDAKYQLEPNGDCCACCGDSGHMAFECGHNPLVAMYMCEQISKGAEELHDMLHRLAGYDIHLGVQLGPARVCLPEGGQDG